LATLEKYYEKVCFLLDNRPKPSLSQAAMEVLAIMAYNPKITRAEIEKIRGVSSDSAINKLIEYGLIEESGRLDTIGRPVTFKTSDEFLRLFGYGKRLFL
jgi:segregation and condensation protein B